MRSQPTTSERKSLLQLIGALWLLRLPSRAARMKVPPSYNLVLILDLAWQGLRFICNYKPVALEGSSLPGW
jgi:hypothetical protein